MKISCVFGPTADTAEHIAMAEQLGYCHAWCYDSPAIGPDMYVTLALAAERTSTIKLGTGMMIPRLRHVVTTAAAYATLNRIAPGRILMGVGAGFTGTRLLGQRPMRWNDIRDYILAVRALLRGEEVSWEGALVKLVPSPDFEKSLPVELPLVVAADGPKGLEVARALSAGLSQGYPQPQEGFEWLLTPIHGTVLEEGESPESDRVWEAAGAGAALAYHALYEYQGGAAVDKLPGGAEWRAQIEAIPAERRHLEIHRHHGHSANERDTEFIPRSMATVLSVVGTSEEVHARLVGLREAGMTEVMFNPSGPDIPHELDKFAEVAMSLQDADAGSGAATANERSQVANDHP